MFTHLCHFLRRSRPRRPSAPLSPEAYDQRQRGQSLILFAIALVGLIAAVGLTVDTGGVYIQYAALKRAVDAAAIAASNEFKTGQTLENIEEAAEEVLILHQLDMSTINLKVYICDAYSTEYDGDLIAPFSGTTDGTRDRYLMTEEPRFFNRCPNTEGGLQAPRKLVWVEATQIAPLFFMRIMGFNDIPLTTFTIAEAAPVDLVIVIDTSESMTNVTFGFTPGDFDPTDCNDNNTCQPLAQAKEAAKLLVGKMHQGYDRIAVVTYDRAAHTYAIPNIQGVPTNLSDDIDEVKNAITSIRANDDAPFFRLWPHWVGPEQAVPTSMGGAPTYYAFNPVNPEDRDGDGFDSDPAFPPCINESDGSVSSNPMCCTLTPNRWDENPKFAEFNWANGGFPCDDDNYLDAFDWDRDGVFTIADHNASVAFLGGSVTQQSLYDLSVLSTCSGCGLQEANNILNQYGRTGAVWIVVFLSDGMVNLSPVPPHIPSGYTNGFCFGPRLSASQVPDEAPAMFSSLWNTMCRDTDPWPRICIRQNASQCPPGSIHQNPVALGYENLSYSPFDFALDQADLLALTTTTNQEPKGNDVGIFSVGLGDIGAVGEQMLRYLAAVGDDGDRTTDPCNGVGAMTSCGQYYYAPTGEQLLPIFEEIASRIYTRITQ